MTNNKKTLIYIDGANPEDKRSWSGSPYNLVQQLKRNYDVETHLVAGNEGGKTLSSHL